MKARLAIFKFTGCSGCQLEILNLENEILDLAEKVDIAYFIEASRKIEPGPYDIALVEGSISTPEQVEHIKKIREESKYVIAIGACATAGGIQALRNWANVKEYKDKVYPHPEWIKTLEKSSPASEYIKVDFEVRGCPVNKSQLLWVLSQILIGKKPFLPTNSLCIQCKIKGNPCVIVTKQEPCLGPVTMTGCGALCPSYNRACYGCYGPSDTPETLKLAEYFIENKMIEGNVAELYKKFTSWKPAFKKVVEKYG